MIHVNERRGRRLPVGAAARGVKRGRMVPKVTLASHLRGSSRPIAAGASAAEPRLGGTWAWCDESEWCSTGRVEHKRNEKASCLAQAAAVRGGFATGLCRGSRRSLGAFGQGRKGAKGRKGPCERRARSAPSMPARAGSDRDWPAAGGALGPLAILCALSILRRRRLQMAMVVARRRD